MDGAPSHRLRVGPPRRLRVGLELTCLELNRGGTSRAAANLWTALEELDTLDIEPLRHAGSPVGSGRFGRDSGRFARGSGRFARGIARELLYFPVGLSHLASARHLDVLHCPSHLMPPRSPCPLVVTLNDVRAWRQPATLTRGNSIQHTLVVRRALRRAAAIITPTEFTRSEVLALIDLDPSKVVVAPYGVPDGFTARPRPHDLLAQLGIPEPYVLVVGTAPHKNVAAAIAAVEHVAKMGAPHGLVIAGPPEDDPDLAAMIARSRIAPRIHLAGYVDDETLVGLYRGAECLLHPSRYEGFGFPPLEAMACAVPVIAARGTATEDVVGHAGVLVDADDLEGFGAALEHLLGSLAARLEYSGRGLARASRFSWQRCAETTAAVYARVAETAVADLDQAA
jgi:alpha-1,3-rhamnosyl/mannosyltransferase